MAEIFTDEGLDYDLARVPGGSAAPATLYIGMFSSQTPTTVPARTATGGATPSGWTELTGTDYARQAIAAASWGAPVTNGNGRRRTAAQVEFPPAGAGGWGTANGFFIATHASSQAGDTILFFANFDDGLAVPIGETDVVRITPYFQKDG